MDISQISNAQTQAAQTNATTTANQDMGKAEFLSLLVAQLQNQDPLSPMDSQDFAAQLAQFSSLEQLSDINNSLKNSSDMDMLLTSSINNTMAANFIGKEVSSYGDNLSLVSGGTSPVDFILQDFSDEVTVKIYDPAGNLVRTMETHGLESGKQSLTWDGKHDQGAELPGGNYRFEIDAINSDGDSVGSVSVSKGIVSSVRYANGTAVLIVNGKEVSLADVLEIG